MLKEQELEHIEENVYTRSLKICLTQTTELFV